MATESDPLFDRLRDDLADLGDRLRDEEFTTELYQALANRSWRRSDMPGRVVVSWKFAENLVNGLRGVHERPALVLAQSGGEGEVSAAVADELGRRGWTSAPVDTGSHDPAHVSDDESPPPPARERRSPRPGARDWERQAHEEAAANRRERA
jgi:hypothetical protein